MIVLENLPLVARLVYDADSEGQRKEASLNTLRAWKLSEKGCWNFIQTKPTQFINTLALDVIQVVDSRNHFQSC